MCLTKLGRRIIAFLSICIFISAWLCSCFYYDEIACVTTNGYWFALASYDGWLCFALQEVGVNQEVPSGSQLSHHRIRPDYECPRFHHPVFGIFASMMWSADGRRLVNASVNVQYRIILAMLVCFLPLMVRNSIRRRIWRRTGRCAFCGYDLRGQRTRCPECGSRRGGGKALLP